MKSKFTKKKKPSEEMALQITSMADIFVILLVFLLKSYSTTLANVTPADGVQLPEALSESQIRDTIKIEITESAVMVDQKSVVPLKNFEFTEVKAEDENGSGAILAALQSVRRPNPLPNMDSNAMILADERMPYATLERVIAAAAKAGFVDLQLVVVKAD